MAEQKSNGENEIFKLKNKLGKEKNKEIGQQEESKLEIENSDEENTPKTLKINELLYKTIKNTSSVFLLSSTTTILNFICNIPLLRAVSKESFGTVKVYFELSFSLINFIPRETIRRTSQKFCPDKDPIKEKEKYILTSQLNMIIMIIFAFIGIIIYFCFVFFTNSTQLHQNLIQLIIYMICALVELLCEPIILYMNLKVENKFIPITLSSLTRILTNTILAVFFKLDLWSFTLARTTGSIVYLSYILYLGFHKYKIDFKDFIPKDVNILLRGKVKNDINIEYLRAVLFQFMRLNLLNLIIQNCEGLVLSFVVKNSEEEKSDYSFVAQNFSLLLKFFIEPVTDGFYILVNKLKYMEKEANTEIIIDNNTNENMSDENTNTSKIKIEEKNEKQEREQEEEQDQDQEKEHLHKTERPSSPDRMIDTRIKKTNSQENNGKENINAIIREPNVVLVLKVLQLFIKIFLTWGTILIAYYALFGIEIMELIYGKKWANNNISKIGDSYTHYVVITSIFDMVESFANSINDSRQMNLSYISYIINSILLFVFMYLFSMWDICGIVMANVLSNLLIINCHLFVVFCGKKEKKQNESIPSSLIDEIKHFQKMCFISGKSIIITSILISLSYFLKEVILIDRGLLTICSSCGVIALINICFICLFEYKQFISNLDEIKSYN